MPPLFTSLIPDEMWDRRVQKVASVPCDERAKTYRMSSPLPRGEESEVRGFRPTYEYEEVLLSSCLPSGL
jgi:hypothetical protein